MLRSREQRRPPIVVPPEICALVCAYLGDARDLASLSACSRISSSWTHWARLHLFQRFSITNQDNHRSLQKFLTGPNGPAIIKNVLRVSVTEQAKISMRKRLLGSSLSQIVSVALPLLPTETFTITGIDWRKFPASGQAVFKDAFARIKILRIFKTRFSHVDDLLLLLSAAPMLQEFIFLGCRFGVFSLLGRTNDYPSFPAPKFTSLTMSGFMLRIFVEWNTFWHTPSTIRAVDISVPWPGMSASQSWLQLQSKLERITFGGYNIAPGYLPGFDIQNCTSIKAFTFHAGGNTRSASQHIRQCLHFINLLPALNEINISVCGAPSDIDYDFDGLPVDDFINFLIRRPGSKIRLAFGRSAPPMHDIDAQRLYKSYWPAVYSLKGQADVEVRVVNNDHDEAVQNFRPCFQELFEGPAVEGYHGWEEEEAV